MSFASSMEAKEFLVSRITEEAKKRHVRLSELERKMLYFSEGYPTLPDIMEVNEQFEAEYDSEKYEEKIKKLSKNAFRRDQKESPENIPLWREAVKVLNTEDHYILVLLDVPRSSADVAKLAAAGVVVAVLGVAAVTASRRAARIIDVGVPDSVKLLAFIVVFALAYYLVYSDKWKVVGKYVVELGERIARRF
jgi:hypothetical protein